MNHEVAEVLNHYSPELSEAWLEQPWNRVNLAHAFAAGFVTNDSDDVHPVADVVLRAAYLGRSN